MAGSHIYIHIYIYIAACTVFKGNCEPGYHCTTGAPLILLCCLGWLVSTVFHMLCLIYVIPKFGKAPPEEEPEHLVNMTFEDKATVAPCTWFSANPVHCLRSQHFHKHNPPCTFWVLGKERFIKANKAIGCFYEEAGTSKK